MGHGHSEDGLVMQKTDEYDLQVIIVSLRDYLPDDRMWHQRMNTRLPSIKMSAGASQLDLLGYIRPRGYLTVSGTIGRLFNLGVST